MKKEVKKLMSSNQLHTNAELKESEPLMTRIRALQAEEKKELLGVKIIAYFLRLLVQPLQARDSQVELLWSKG
jgi:hypothetical protein